MEATDEEMGDFESERKGFRFGLGLVDLKIAPNFRIDLGFSEQCALNWDWIWFFGEKRCKIWWGDGCSRGAAMRKLLNMSNRLACHADAHTSEKII